MKQPASPPRALTQQSLSRGSKDPVSELANTKDLWDLRDDQEATRKSTVPVLLPIDSACRFDRIELSALALASTSQLIGLIPMVLTQAAMLAATMVNVHVHTSSDDASACSTCKKAVAVSHSVACLHYLSYFLISLSVLVDPKYNAHVEWAILLMQLRVL